MSDSDKKIRLVVKGQKKKPEMEPEDAGGEATGFMSEHAVYKMYEHARLSRKDLLEIARKGGVKIADDANIVKVRQAAAKATAKEARDKYENEQVGEKMTKYEQKHGKEAPAPVGRPPIPSVTEIKQNLKEGNVSQRDYIRIARALEVGIVNEELLSKRDLRNIVAPEIRKILVAERKGDKRAKEIRLKLKHINENPKKGKKHVVLAAAPPPPEVKRKRKPLPPAPKHPIRQPKEVVIPSRSFLRSKQPKSTIGGESEVWSADDVEIPASPALKVRQPRKSKIQEGVALKIRKKKGKAKGKGRKKGVKVFAEKAGLANPHIRVAPNGKRQKTNATQPSIGVVGMNYAVQGTQVVKKIGNQRESIHPIGDASKEMKKARRKAGDTKYKNWSLNDFYANGYAKIPWYKIEAHNGRALRERKVPKKQEVLKTPESYWRAKRNVPWKKLYPNKSDEDLRKMKRKFRAKYRRERQK